MTTEPSINLSDIPLFHSLPTEEIARLQETFEVQEVSSANILFKEGEVSDAFYVILKGEVEIIKALGSPEESILGVRQAGEYIGEMGLLNQDGVRTASARARTNARVLVAHYASFTELLSRQPQLAYQLARVLSTRMTAAQNETIETLRDKNARLQQAYDELKAAQEQIIQKEKLERELQLAREIQYSILPGQLPGMGGYDFGALMIPARAVGGDFYGIFPLDEERMVLVVGDVTDKGVPAAIFMAQTHALLRASATVQLSTSQVLERVNDYLMEMNDKGLFVTVVYGVLEKASGEFVYTRAGHELPLIVDAKRQASYVKMGGGMALGLWPEPMLAESRVLIPPGGMLILYSDGVTDCTNTDEKTFEAAGLAEFVQTLPAELDAQQTCKAIYDQLVVFQGEAPQFDDVTLLAVRRLT